MILTKVDLPPVFYVSSTQRSGSFGRVLDWGLKGRWFPDSAEALCCVLEQDTLSPA